MPLTVLPQLWTGFPFIVMCASNLYFVLGFSTAELEPSQQQLKPALRVLSSAVHLGLHVFVSLFFLTSMPTCKKKKKERQVYGHLESPSLESHPFPISNDAFLSVQFLISYLASRVWRMLPLPRQEEPHTVLRIQKMIFLSLSTQMVHIHSFQSF